MREWVTLLEPPAQRVFAATFDTRMHSPHVPGSAAAGAWRLLNKRGFEVAAEAESFWVTGLRGPLRDGELDRAYAWGVGLSGLVLESHPAGPPARRAPTAAPPGEHGAARR